MIRMEGISRTRIRYSEIDMQLLVNSAWKGLISGESGGKGARPVLECPWGAGGGK